MQSLNIGPYEIRGELGRGAMAVVWRAWDPNLEREVAIKEPLFAPTLDAALREELTTRFLREGKTVAAFSHPGIVTVYAADVYDGRPALVMELIEGSTLADVLQRGALTHQAAAAITDQLLDSLAYAHSRGVVHRDIKPDNVFVTDEGRVKLADFGIARFSEHTRFTQEGTVMGTPGYMAPEQVRGLSADARADIFATGAILYEMLSGENPFGASAGIESTAIMYRIVHEDPPPLPSETADPLRTVALVALNKDPDARFASAEEMRAALAGAGTGRAVVASHGTVPTSLNRVPAWAYVGALLIVTTIGLAVVLQSPAQKGTVTESSVAAEPESPSAPSAETEAVGDPEPELGDWLTEVQSAWDIVERGWYNGEPEADTYGMHYWSMHQSDVPLVETPLNRLERKMAEHGMDGGTAQDERIMALNSANVSVRTFLELWPDDTSPERAIAFARARWAVYRAEVLIDGSNSEKQQLRALDQLLANLPVDVPLWTVLDDELGPVEVSAGGDLGGWVAGSSADALYQLTWPDTGGTLIAVRVDAAETPFAVDFGTDVGGLTMVYTGGNAITEWDWLDPRSASPDGRPSVSGDVIVYGFSPGSVPYEDAEASLRRTALVN